MAACRVTRPIIPATFAFWLSLLGGRAEGATLQYVEAWLNGKPLPSSTNQVTDESTCKSAIVFNAQQAPTYGYIVDDLAVDQSSVTYRDARNGVTVKQSCVPASPWMEALPKRPLSGAKPPLPPQVPCPAPTS